MTLLDDLVQTSLRVAATRARREKIRDLAACLRRLAPEEIEAGAGFLAGAPRQAKIGLGWAAVRDVAPEPALVPSCSVRELDETLDRIAAMSGRGSKEARLGALRDLLARATAPEQRFIKGLLVGEVRQGALEGILVAAIAAAAALPEDDVRRALMLRGDLGAVARAALAEGAAGLSKFRLVIGRPIQLMLAQSADDVEDALARLARGPGGAALEWKLDGARVQLHKDGGDVRVFSRRLNDVTAAVPDLVEAARRLPVERIVLDGEAIALRADGAPLPFQVTMRRFGRRAEVERLRGEIPLSPFFFDCIHLDGDDLLDRTAAERHAALASALPAPMLVPRIVTASADAAEAFLADALRHGHEGLMAKATGGAYEAGRRGAGWLKVKLAHTLDLVVLAAEWGSGRRRGWLSNLHLGARDPGSGAFVMLGKTFKGMTDEMLAWQTQRLQEMELARDDWTVYVRPELVVEVAFDGVQASPHYPGGMALRFARVKRYRPDKAAAEADTVDRIRAIHAAGA
jgi:DNA ligase-1